MSLDRENPLRAEKRAKLHRLKAAGIDPFPHNFERSCVLNDIRQKHEGLGPGVKTEEFVKVAGRVMARRDMGKASFLTIRDEKANMQVYLKSQELSETATTVFDNLDIGDFLGVEGKVFTTQKGELSVHASDLQMLCKTLEPLPEKFHGLTDTELKYRYRHLDLVMDMESRKVFETRSAIIREVRRFLDDRGFMEVETPILQPIYGGAAAHPFKTHHRALDMTLFLKISPELYLKRLIVGGFEKVYDMNKNFRNEGIDRTHNPEFTMIEWYEAYTDYKYQMTQFEELVAHVCLKTRGTTKFEYQGKEIDFKPPWRRLSVYDGIKEYAGGLEVEKCSNEELYAALKDHGFEDKCPPNRGQLIMALFEQAVEKHLWDPTFIIDFPVEISPLTKMHREKKDLVERFEPMAAHMELGNSYSELNDPEDQFERLKSQEAQRETDEEAHPMDEDFVHAIDVGMPPTGGVGLGIERLVMLLTDRPSIKDIIFFPTMKHK